MKTIYSFISGLTLIVLLLCSCVDDCIINEYNGYISVDVSDDGGNTTRTAYSGLTTTFENGDAIGIYVVDGSGTVQASNVQYTKSGDSWTSSTPLSFNPDWKYYAYFPYVATPYTPDFTASGIDNQFDDFITDASDKFHYADQSTKANFMASDLMVAQGELTGSSGVHFSMDHKKGLAVLEGEGATITSYEGNIPYINGGKGYFLMKADAETILAGNTLTARSGRYVTYDVPIPFDAQYLTFTALEDGYFQLRMPGNVHTMYITDVSYSLDNGVTWVTTANSSSYVTITTPTVAAGEKVLWKGNGKSTTALSYNDVSTFQSSGRYEVSGNLLSLIKGNHFRTDTYMDDYYQYTFSRLFYMNTKLVSAENLVFPTSMIIGCYRGMFSYCDELITPPKLLPATTLKGYCYQEMFAHCPKLATAPELPATTLANYCYQSMFSYCSSLTTAPKLPATTLSDVCYSSMFSNCSSLTEAPELPATTLAYQCYQGMFYYCSKLTTAPELPAETLVNNCYKEMFRNCSNINYIKAAFTTTLSTSYTQNWVSGVASSGTFVKNSAAAWDVTGASGVPSGWTTETYTP